MKASIVWFRQDLRLGDNPALAAAIKRGVPIIPVYIWSPEEECEWSPGGASRWRLHQSLSTLSESLQNASSRLIIHKGNSLQILKRLAEETDASAVYWNIRYEPAAAARDLETEMALRAEGIETQAFNGNLLFDPRRLRNHSGHPFRVFTPFWKACLAQPSPALPVSAPEALPAPEVWPKSLPLEELELESKIDWAAGMRAIWRPGEQGAALRLREFVEDGLEKYDEDRNRPDLPGSSRLSPHLHFGEISPRQIWHVLQSEASQRPELGKGAESFLRELGWREFAYHLLHHFPWTAARPLRAQYESFPWRKNARVLEAWQKGQTGFPIVDAGMRELWATGWMHNRVRMIVASFLVKDLLIPWQEGAKWFWDTLVDADLASNTLGWQWTAGCGADGAPYFRIFNPSSQGEKFDPDGRYVRRWAPELAGLPNEYIHKPWEAPPMILASAGVELGRTYPKPLIDHAFARERALEALAAIKKQTAKVAKVTKI